MWWGSFWACCFYFKNVWKDFFILLLSNGLTPFASLFGSLSAKLVTTTSSSFSILLSTGLRTAKDYAYILFSLWSTYPASWADSSSLNVWILLTHLLDEDPFFRDEGCFGLPLAVSFGLCEGLKRTDRDWLLFFLLYFLFTALSIENGWSLNKSSSNWSSRILATYSCSWFLEAKVSGNS